MSSSTIPSFTGEETETQQGDKAESRSSAFWLRKSFLAPWLIDRTVYQVKPAFQLVPLESPWCLFQDSSSPPSGICLWDVSHKLSWAIKGRCSRPLWVSVSTCFLPLFWRWSGTHSFFFSLFVSPSHPKWLSSWWKRWVYTWNGGDVQEWREKWNPARGLDHKVW